MSRPDREFPVSLPDLKMILEESAEIVRELFHQGGPVGKKSDGSPLTPADLRANRFLQTRLLGLLPGVGWLSEEGAPDEGRLDRPWIWIVDPVDGTKEFARGIPELAISIGLVKNHQVVAAGVINPITGEGGVGSSRGGAEFWGFPSARKGAQNLEEAVAGISRRETDDGTVIPYLDLVGSVRVLGSVAYKLLRVAFGLEDLTFSVQHKSEWDVCGGVGLLNFAGKLYRRFDGQPLQFNQPNTRIRCGAVAGPEKLVEEFILKLKERSPGAGLPGEFAPWVAGGTLTELIDQEENRL